MKKIALVASLATVAFAISAFVAPNKTTTAADAFEGVVTYSITTDNAQYSQMIAGATYKVYIKGGKTKTSSDMGMYKSIILTDNATPDAPVILLDIMGNKYQLKDDKNMTDEKDPVIKYIDTTKVIAGYTCHKAQVTSTDAQGKTATVDVYYTEDIPAYTGKSSPIKGLKGFPMQFTKNRNGVNMDMVATKVEKQTVADDTFTLPKGYALMTMEEMQADIQKKMSSGGDGGN